MSEEQWKISLQDAAQKLAEIDATFVELFRRGDFSAELYAPENVDPTATSPTDEVYLVASGSGTFLRGEERVSFVCGDFLFVPAGVVHRFEQFTKDFSTWVLVFWTQGRIRQHIIRSAAGQRQDNLSALRAVLRQGPRIRSRHVARCWHVYHSSPITFPRPVWVMFQMVRSSRAEDGCEEYVYAEDLFEPGLIHVKELWRNQSALGPSLCFCPSR